MENRNYSVKTNVTYCKFLVNMLKRTDGCDVFVIGVDDFVPKEFYTEGDAIDWIYKQEFGKYTITKIYYK